MCESCKVSLHSEEIILKFMLIYRKVPRWCW